MLAILKTLFELQLALLNDMNKCKCLNIENYRSYYYVLHSINFHTGANNIIEAELSHRFFCVVLKMGSNDSFFLIGNDAIRGCVNERFPGLRSEFLVKF